MWLHRHCPSSSIYIYFFSVDIQKITPASFLQLEGVTCLEKKFRVHTFKDFQKENSEGLYSGWLCGIEKIWAFLKCSETKNLDIDKFQHLKDFWVDPPMVKRATTGITRWQQEVMAVRAGGYAPPSLPAGCHHDQPTPYTTHRPVHLGKCQMDKPALRHTELGRMKSP